MATITLELLQALQSPETQVRSQAETHYANLSVQQKVEQLAAILPHLHNQPNLELLAVVLLRRQICRLADADILVAIMTPLLQLFPTSQVSLHIANCLAEACGSLSAIAGDDAPKAAMANILATIESSVGQGHAASLKLLANMANRSPKQFVELNVVDSLPQLISATKNAALQPNQLEAFVDLACNAAIAMESDASQQHKSAQLGLSVMPTLLSHTVRCADPYRLEQITQHLTHACMACPALLTGHDAVLEALLQTCLHLIAHHRDSSLITLEVVASVLHIPSALHRVQNNQIQAVATNVLIQTIFDACFHFMIDPVDPDVQEWAEEPATLMDAVDSFIGEDQASHAEALAVDFARTLQLSFRTTVRTALAAHHPPKDWRTLRAALNMHECCCLGSGLEQRDVLQTWEIALQSLNSNVRVQWQALRLLITICDDYGPLVCHHHATELRQHASALVASSCTKVSALASLLFVSYGRGVGADEDIDIEASLLPYLPSILDALIRGPLYNDSLEEGHVTAQVRAMDAIACFANVIGDEFTPHYARVMPGLVASAQRPSTELACGAIQAATIVGQAVGAEVFAETAHQLLAIMVPAIQSATTNHNVPLEQLLSACARIASVIGSDFLPHMNTVLPVLLQQARLEADVSIVEGTEVDLDQSRSRSPYLPPQDDIFSNTDTMTVTLPGRGITKITINTSNIQEKTQAIRALYELATALSDDFGAYSEVCLQTLIPILTFKYSSEVRSCTFQTAAAVFDSTCEYAEQAGGPAMVLASKYLPGLAETMSNQMMMEDPTDMEACADGLSEVCYIAHRYIAGNVASNPHNLFQSFTQQQGRAVLHNCMRTMVGCFERRNALRQNMSNMAPLPTEGDAKPWEEQHEMEAEIVTQLVHTAGYILKFFKHNMTSAFEELAVPVLSPILQNASLDVRLYESEIATSITLFGDCVGHCGADAATRHTRTLMQATQRGLQQIMKSEKITKACLDALTDVSRHGPWEAVKDIPRNSQLYQLAMTDKESLEDPFMVVSAQSAICNVVFFRPESPTCYADAQSHMGCFLNSLPFTQDDDEAKAYHARFCSFMESGAIDMESGAMQMVQIIARIMNEVYEDKDVVLPETVQRFQTIVAGIKSKLQPPQDWAFLMQHLPEAEQASLHTLLSS